MDASVQKTQRLNEIHNNLQQGLQFTLTQFSKYQEQFTSARTPTSKQYYQKKMAKLKKEILRDSSLIQALEQMQVKDKFTAEEEKV